eukprot:s1818_g15.t1
MRTVSPLNRGPPSTLTSKAFYDTSHLKSSFTTVRGCPMMLAPCRCSRWWISRFRLAWRFVLLRPYHEFAKGPFHCRFGPLG